MNHSTGLQVLTLTVMLLFVTLIHGNDDHCVKEYFDQNSFVCVCNISVCPNIEPATPVSKGYIDSWESSRDQYRFHRTQLSINDLARPLESNMLQKLTLPYKKLRIQINIDDQRQTIHGFGGAITDATGLNLLNLPVNLSDSIMSNYFSKNGLDYSVTRVPIGGTDFSTRIYTYADDQPDDFELEHFALEPEDKLLKIPLIKQALKLKEGNLKLLGSAWSPPGWMKTNNNITGSGFLKGSPGGPYYKAWAKYYVKFLEAYAKEGIDFWGITTQNEPTQAIVHQEFFYNCLGLTPQQLRDFVKLDLGPVLRDAGYGTDKLQVLLHDDIRDFLPSYTEAVLNDTEAASYVTGIGYHWYKNGLEDFYENLNLVHSNFPNHFLFSTEACEGFARFSTERAQLGNWTRAETYAVDIIEDLNRFTTGWLDWNLALNTQGGPSWAENWTDGLILVDASKATYYRNPMFYSLGHFSKFIPPNSVYIGHEVQGDSQGVYVAAFIDPSDQMVMVILNTNDSPVDLIIEKFTSVSVPIAMDAHSIRTLITPRI
ncbi:glucosylceramidase [Tetranychus urticae]|nr:glucosylceramidase [Tetranychus urticae]